MKLIIYCQHLKSESLLFCYDINTGNARAGFMILNTTLLHSDNHQFSFHQENTDNSNSILTLKVYNHSLIEATAPWPHTVPKLITSFFRILSSPNTSNCPAYVMIILVKTPSFIFRFLSRKFKNRSPDDRTNKCQL